MAHKRKLDLALVLVMGVVAALLTACGVGAAPSTAAVVATSVPAPTATDVPEATATPSVEITFNVDEPADGNNVQATLIPQAGRVEVRRADRTTYETLLRDQAVLVTTGDMIRTGADGQAKLVFEDDTETTIFEDTVLAIGEFTSNDDGSHNIRLMQFIGMTFNRVNFAHANSREEIMTPYGVASVRGTSYWVEVTISGLFADRLLTQQLETFVAELGASILAGDINALQQAVLDLLGGEQGTVTVDVVAGTIIFRDNSGNQVTIQTGFTANSGTDANGNTVRVTTTIINRYCGDGICDVYLGETASTCPADC